MIKLQLSTWAVCLRTSADIVPPCGTKSASPSGFIIPSKSKLYYDETFITFISVFFLVHLSAISQEKPKPVPALFNANQPIPQEIIKATREFRERLLADPYRPAFHFCIPEGNGHPGDPNGAFYYNGRYHPDAIGSGNGDEGCFSGGAFVDDDGSAVLSYWMLWGAKGIGLAKSVDSDFNMWKKVGNNPVVQSTEWGITSMKDEMGRQIMWSWIFDDRPDSVINHWGWTGTYGLQRTLWLGSDGTLRMRPAKELENLRMNELSFSNIKVLSGKEQKLNKPDMELQELEITIQPGKAVRYGVKVCISDDGREETVIYYDNSDRKLKFDTRKSGLSFGRKIIEEAPLELKQDEPLVLKIYIDRSIVEVFANDKQAIARMVYPTLGGKGVKLFSEGGDIEVKTIKAWELSPSNTY